MMWKYRNGGGPPKPTRGLFISNDAVMDISHRHCDAGELSPGAEKLSALYQNAEYPDSLHLRLAGLPTHGLNLRLTLSVYL